MIVCAEDSVDSIQNWEDTYFAVLNFANEQKISNGKVKVYGILNKKDLHDDSNDELNTAIEEFNEFNEKYFTTQYNVSSKDGNQIKELFIRVASDIYESNNL